MEKLKLTRRASIDSARAAGALLFTGGGPAAFVPRLTELAGGGLPLCIRKPIPTVWRISPARCCVVAYVQDERLCKYLLTSCRLTAIAVASVLTKITGGCVRAATPARE